MKYAYQGKPLYPVVEIYHDLIAHLGEVTMKDFFFDKEACAKAWKLGSEKLKEYFGDLLPLRAPAGAPLSYGHLVCMGAPLSTPDHTEPNIKPFAKSIGEALELAYRAQEICFEDQPIVQHYIEVWEYLKKAFPDEDVAFAGPSYEGPITSAVLMRGQDFFCDLYDEPEKCQEFLNLLTSNIAKYALFMNQMNGITEWKKDNCGLADDFASLVSPDMWDEVVIPCWNQYYEEQSLPGCKRSVHVEGLSPKHLPKLRLAKINHYQPSVSDRIRLEDALEQRGKAYDEFDWLLYAYRVTDMTDVEIQAWVDRVAEANVAKIRTQVGEFTCKAQKFDRIKAFYKAFEKYRVE